MKGRDYAVDTGVDGKVILEYSLSLRVMGWERAYLILLVQDKDQWRFLVNTVMLRH
jgi:hypothetical protein